MKKLIFFSLACLIALSAIAQHDSQTRYYPPTDPLVKQKLDQWQDLKFGLLMHWGPYSQWGIVESWSICSEDEGWCRRNMDNYTDYKVKYENLQTTFNPTKFDPQKWAKAAAYAGMKYVVFTTKHHDGFCMFDSKYTDYKITDPKTPFHKNSKANVAKEIFSAFRAEGLWTGAYFSKPDWHSEYFWWPNFATPDRMSNYSIQRYPERWEKFVQFTHNQIMELMTDYGPMDILWLDGGWVRKMTREEIDAYVHDPDYNFIRMQNQDIRMDELAAKARQKQPGLIVVDRAVEGPNQNYLTPENTVPKEQLDYPWESCMILGGGWSYSFDAKYMSGRQVVHLLTDIVAKGGNLLLNIGPSPEGTWDEGAYKSLEETGNWMKVNGEAIYGTRKSVPYYDGAVYHTEKKDGSAHYIIYCLKEGESMPELFTVRNYVPKENARIDVLGMKGSIKFEKTDVGLLVRVPKKVRDTGDQNYAVVFRIQ
jgi:alpha-L-fucosidase